MVSLSLGNAVSCGTEIHIGSTPTGPAGSGKTALAATMALGSDYPFIKLISPESMVGFSESGKINELNKIFSDSYKSPISVIVIDSIERILGEYDGPPSVLLDASDSA